MGWDGGTALLQCKFGNNHHQHASEAATASAMPTSNRNLVLKPLARALKRNMTDAEQRLWHHLRGKRLNGIKFRRQQSIGTYIVDFVSLEYKLVVELDGGQHVEQAAHDAERTQFLNQEGYCVLRFWNHDVLQQTEAVLEKIAEACNCTPPP